MPGTDVTTPPQPGSIVLLGGPPGAGKTAVAGVVAAAAPRPTVHLPTDSFYVWIRSGFVVPSRPEAETQNETVTAVMVAAACGYARGGYDVIADGILGPWLLPAFQAACARQRLGLSYIVLRPSLEIALARATARTGRQLTDPEPIIGLYGAFADLGELEGHVIDSGAQTVEETAAAVAAAIGQDRFTLQLRNTLQPGSAEAVSRSG
jgi:chloramphenicol 3-O-phosphotransferase